MTSYFAIALLAWSFLAACSLQRSAEQSQNVMSQPFEQVSAAVGYGAASKGGTGGEIITLATTDAAAFKAALTRTGARTVMLTGSGIIDLTDDITINSPFLTIDGSGAPNLQIRGGMLIVKTHDVIIRHLRIRPGDGGPQPSETDAICLCGRSGADVYNVYIENNSLMWGPDMGAVAMLDNVHDVTLVGNILGPGLYVSRHRDVAIEGSHSMGTSMFRLIAGGVIPYNITLVHNLFTSSDRRNPVAYGSNIEIVNNVVYNWGRRPSGGNPSKANFINNFVKAGPMTLQGSGRVAWSPQLHSQSPTYFSQAVYEAGTGGITARGDPQSVYRDTPWPMTISNPQTAAAAYSTVLDQAGAQPRDSIDAQIITDVRNGTGGFPNAADLDWSTTQVTPVPSPTVAPTQPQPTATPLPTVTPQPTSTPLPPTEIPWITLTCPSGQIQIEQLDTVSARWRCQ